MLALFFSPPSYFIILGKSSISPSFSVFICGFRSSILALFFSPPAECIILGKSSISPYCRVVICGCWSSILLFSSRPALLGASSSSTGGSSPARFLLSLDLGLGACMGNLARSHFGRPVFGLVPFSSAVFGLLPFTATSATCCRACCRQRIPSLCPLAHPRSASCLWLPNASSVAKLERASAWDGALSLKFCSLWGGSRGRSWPLSLFLSLSPPPSCFLLG